MVCPEDEVPLWAFGIVVIPISILIGIATTTIGFTAWTIVVPLFFAGFKKKNFTLFEALFMSVLLDCTNSAIATAMFAKQSKVDWALGLIFAFVSIFGSLFGLIFSNNFLERYQSMFKRGLGYISLIIGLSFFFRGFMMWRRTRGASETPIDDPPSISKEKSIVQTESSHLMSLGLMGPTTVVVVSPASLSGSDSTPQGSPQQVSVDKTALVELLEAAKAVRRKRLRMLSAVLSCIVAGVASGLIGFGGGMIFVLVFFILLQKEQLLATGTGCFVMCALTAWLALIYETGGSWLDFAEHIHFSCIWEELLMLLLGGAFGSFLGSFFVMGVSPVKLNLLVGTVLFVTGLVATIQSQVFPGDDDSSSASSPS